MAKISVLGAGSWGTALSILLYNNGGDSLVGAWGGDNNIKRKAGTREQTSGCKDS